MSEEKHTGGLCCSGPGDHGPGPESTDPGSKSLADALRVSFVLLAVIMLFMVVGFALTGLQSIEANEVGIVKVFGREVGTVGAGLTYNWPFPIGEIEIVKTDEQRVTLYDFWINEMPGDLDKPLAQRRAPSEGLRPGWDGALLTGDRYLLHVKIDCRYVVDDPLIFRQQVRDPYGEHMPGLAEPITVDPKEEIVRSAVCSAAIITAATGTADGLQTSDRSAFARDVLKRANKTLSGADGSNKPTGLRIKRLVLADTTWPLRAIADFNAVTGASQAARQRTDAAASEAERMLRQAAGQAYTQLVGDPRGGPDTAEKARKNKKPYDLIGQYSSLRSRADSATDPEQVKTLDAQAEAVFKQIDAVLVSHELTGDASSLITKARAQGSRTKQRIEARLNLYKRLLPEYKRAPRLTIERLWASAREEILAAAAEKYYISAGKGKTVLKINRDPETLAQQVRKKLEALKKPN